MTTDSQAPTNGATGTPEPHDPADNLYQRLKKARLEITSVPKRGKADSLAGKYDFVTHDDAVNAVVPPLLRHGVLPVHRPRPETRKQDWMEREKKAAMGLTEVESELLLINIDKPEEVLAVPSFGYGLDTQDKGPGKAMSYAKKYAILNALCLQTGEDVETGSVDAKPPGARRAASQRGEAQSSKPDPLLTAMWVAVRGAGIADDTLRLYLQRRFNTLSTRELSGDQLKEVTEWARALPALKRTFAAQVKASGTDGTVLVNTAKSLSGAQQADVMTVEEWKALIESAREIADEALPWDSQPAPAPDEEGYE